MIIRVLVLSNGLSSLPENRAFDPNNVKAVLSTENKILFLSRKSIRHSLNAGEPTYLKQLGLYGFTTSLIILLVYSTELTENIEMMRCRLRPSSLRYKCFYSINIC